LTAELDQVRSAPRPAPADDDVPPGELTWSSLSQLFTTNASAAQP
jgi:hypothetical protein